MSNKTWDATIRERIETFQETLPDSPGVRNYDEILKKRVALQEKVQSLTGNKRHEAESELRAVTLQFEKEFERQCNTYKACRDFLRGLIRDNLPESREYLKELLAKETPIASQTEMSQTPPQSPIHTENVLESHFNVEADDSQPFNDETNASNTITKSPLISAKDSKIVRAKRKAVEEEPKSPTIFKRHRVDAEPQKTAQPSDAITPRGGGNLLNIEQRCFTKLNWDIDPRIINHKRKWYILQCERGCALMTFESIEDAKTHLSACHGQGDVTDEMVIAACGMRVVNCKRDDVKDYNRHKIWVKEGADSSAYHPGKRNKAKKKPGPKKGSSRKEERKVTDPRPQGQTEGQTDADKSAMTSNKTPIYTNQEDPIAIPDDDSEASDDESLPDLFPSLNRRRTDSATAEPTGPLQKSTEEPQKEKDAACRTAGKQSAFHTAAAPDVSTALQLHINGKKSTSNNTVAKRSTAKLGSGMAKRSKSSLFSGVRRKTPAQPCADMGGPSTADNGSAKILARPPISPTNERLEKGVKGIAPTTPKRRSLASHPSEPRTQLSSRSPARPRLGGHSDTLTTDAQKLKVGRTSNTTAENPGKMSFNAERQDKTDSQDRSKLVQCTECHCYCTTLSSLTTHYATVHPGKKSMPFRAAQRM